MHAHLAVDIFTILKRFIKFLIKYYHPVLAQVYFAELKTVHRDRTPLFLGQ